MGPLPGLLAGGGEGPCAQPASMLAHPLRLAPLPTGREVLLFRAPVVGGGAVFPLLPVWPALRAGTDDPAAMTLVLPLPHPRVFFAGSKNYCTSAILEDILLLRI